MKKYILFILVLLSIFVLSSNKMKCIDYSTIELAKDAKSACLIEAKTSTILYAKNENERLAPASMTKVMSLIIIMEKIDKGEIQYSDVVTTPKEASSLGGSQIYLSENEEMTVEDLIKSMCIASANDATMSLAIYIGGSMDNFVNMMNDKVTSLNLKNTNFVNPYGFDDPNHYTSSLDMAIMSSYLINNYPKVLEYTKTYESYVREDSQKRFWLVNTNKLVKFLDGCDGLKTGYTSKSGYCLSATIKRNNNRFIAVAMGCSTSKIRNSEITNMLNYASNNYETITIVKKGQIMKKIRDINLYPNNFTLFSRNSIFITKKKNEQVKDIRYEEDFDYKNNIYKLKVFYNNELITILDLEPNKDVKEATILELMLVVFKEIFLITK